MRAIVLAYHDIGCAGIEALVRNGIEIVAVFTHKDDPKENIWFQSVAELAASKNIPVYAPDDINHPFWVQKIKDLKPDILLSFYYRKLIKPSILEIPPQGCLNLHSSLLPSYRGRSPINWVLVNGEKETGVSLHYMTTKPDDGDIVCQKKIEISDEDTAKSLHQKAVKATGELLDEISDQIKNNTVLRIPQDHSKSSYYGGRCPEDGEIDWTKTAREVRNLVRAVTRPYPGAFTRIGGKKCFIWSVTETNVSQTESKHGMIISTDPLTVSCGQGALNIDFGEQEGGVYMTGPQLATELALTKGLVFGRKKECKAKHVLIIGINGFIGNALGECLLESGAYEVHGMDIRSDSINRFKDNPRFHFHEGDIAIHREWIEYHVKKCDIILPLVAIATPIEYTRNPLRVFELGFEENLRVVRYCVKYNKRIIFPSTSEVYGMCEEENFDEDRSKLVLGPIKKQRWIYSCIKQLLDRVIWAYGQSKGLQFTLFRPFNWIGPRLDNLESARIGSSRVITQLILNLVEGTPILLIDGGNQKRCFTDVSDGIECLFRIIENKNNSCDRKIINIGNPQNEISIRELAKFLVEKFEKHPLRKHFPPFAGFREIESKLYYGDGYQDVQHRKPNIQNAKKLVGWNPTVTLEESVKKTLDFFLQEAVRTLNIQC